MEIKITKTPYGREVVEVYEDDKGVKTNRPLVNRIFEREIDALDAMQRWTDKIKKDKIDDLESL